MSTNLDLLVEGSADLGALHSAICRIIGRKCWKVAFTFGSELSLHFGRHLAYDNPRMKGKRFGQWRFGTRATDWTLFTPNGLVSSKEEDEQSLERKAKVLEGQKVTKFNVSVPDNVLMIAFGDDYSFQVTPTRNDARSKMPYWKLLMPDHLLVTFGPGNVWSCRRSDVFWESLARQTGTDSPEETKHVLETLAGTKKKK